MIDFRSTPPANDKYRGRHHPPPPALQSAEKTQPLPTAKMERSDIRQIFGEKRSMRKRGCTWRGPRGVWWRRIRRRSICCGRCAGPFCHWRRASPRGCTPWGRCRGRSRRRSRSSRSCFVFDRCDESSRGEWQVSTRALSRRRVNYAGHTQWLARANNLPIKTRRLSLSPFSRVSALLRSLSLTSLHALCLAHTLRPFFFFSPLSRASQSDDVAGALGACNGVRGNYIQLFDYRFFKIRYMGNRYSIGFQTVFCNFFRILKINLVPDPAWAIFFPQSYSRPLWILLKFEIKIN